MAFRLVHLSDLHFGRTFIGMLRRREARTTSSSDVQLILTEIGKLNPRPDVIAISGDLIESPLSRIGVREAVLFLKNLSGLCQRVVICTGNHDVRPGGFVSFRPLQGLFRRWFRKRFSAYLKHHVDNVNGVLVHQIDSTGGGTFARGEFSDSELSSAYSAYAADAVPRLRICLAHHHALPVIASESGKFLKRLQHTTLIAGNPGHFLDFLLELKFSVLLHGHEHVPSFWTLMAHRDDGPRALSVVACGSSTGAGGSRAPALGLLDYNGYGIPTYRYYRRPDNAQYFRPDDVPRPLLPLGISNGVVPAGQAGGVSCARLIRHVSFDEFGDASFKQTLLGLESNIACETLDFPIRSGAGLISQVKVEECDPGSASIQPLKTKGAAHESIPLPQERNCSVKFSPPLTQDLARRVVLSGRIANAFATSSDEVGLLPSSRRVADFGDQEVVGLKIPCHVDFAELEVEFEGSVDLAQFKGASAFALDANGIRVERESKRVANTLFLDMARRRLTISINNPLFEHSYGFHWLPPRSGFFGLGTSAETHRAALLSANPTRAREYLISARDKLEKSLFVGSATSRKGAKKKVDQQDHLLHLSLSTYCPTKKLLVDIATTDPEYEATPLQLAIGEGIAGRAFKTGLDVRCVPERIDKHNRELYRYAKKPHQALLSIPDIRVTGNGTKSPIAVLTVGTYVRDCEFYRFVSKYVDGVTDHEVGAMAQVAKTARELAESICS